MASCMQAARAWNFAVGFNPLLAASQAAHNSAYWPSSYGAEECRFCAMSIMHVCVGTLAARREVETGYGP